MRILPLRAALASVAFASAPLLLSAQATPAADTRPGIAVFPLVNGGSYGEKKEDLTLLSLGLQQSVMNELSLNSNLRVVDRGSLRDLLQEQDLGASGRVDPATAAKIGKLVGARYVVTGGFIDLYGQFQLNGRIVDVQTGEIVKSTQVQGEKTKLFKLVSDMAEQVTAGVKLPPLPPAVRDARKNREVPAEAMGRYADILAFRDAGGDRTKTVQLYRDLIRDFPQVEEYRTELKQFTP